MTTSLPQNLEPGAVHFLPPFPDFTSTSNPHICILDSSFNPPHLAHLAMASSPFPRTFSTYTHRLLLFSLSNVDKSPTPHDPTLTQRFHMINLLAQHIRRTHPEPVHLGLLNDATFAGKSKALHKALANLPGLNGENVKPRLTFLIGTDTLARFFVERYYPKGKMEEVLSGFFEKEGSGIVCARRGNDEESRGVEERILGDEGVKKWVETGRVGMFGMDEEDWVGLSSTDVRKAVGAGDWDKLGKLVIPEIAEYIREEGLYTGTGR